MLQKTAPVQCNSVSSQLQLASFVWKKAWQRTEFGEGMMLAALAAPHSRPPST